MHSMPAPSALAISLRQRKYRDDLERRIVERLRTEARSDRARTELARQTGIADSQLLAELADLGLTTRTMGALRLIPLVRVAWADNHVDAQERQAVLTAATSLGIHRGSDAYVMLERWLREMPPAERIDAWERYLKRVMEKLGKTAQLKLIQFLRAQMIAIAKASGGYFGFGKVSAKERQTIESFMNALSD